jgi:hypothetical protein
MTQGTTKKHEWFDGETVTNQVLAKRYGLHKATIGSFWRMEADSKDPKAGVLNRIRRAKNKTARRQPTQMPKKYGLGPRKDPMTIPPPTEYEKKLWGH